MRVRQGYFGSVEEEDGDAGDDGEDRGAGAFFDVVPKFTKWFTDMSS